MDSHCSILYREWRVVAITAVESRRIFLLFHGLSRYDKGSSLFCLHRNPFCLADTEIHHVVREQKGV